MYVIYQPNFGVARFPYKEEYHPMRPMGPSACQWIVPGTVGVDD